jgi:putative ABC transport system ATP-binding protein
MLPAPEPLLRVAGVSKSFREGGTESVVLRDASLELAAAQTTSIIGASGSGKSTLLGVIAGLLQPESGRVFYDGCDVTGLDDRARARLRAGPIGMVLQSDNLIPFLNAVENVELAIAIGGAGRARRRASALLSDLGLAQRLHHRPGQLSGGEAQRVAVAVALANDPTLLLADEATGELDAATAERTMGLILDVSHQRALTLLYVTHNRQFAEEAPHQLRLVDGEVGPA